MNTIFATRLREALIFPTHKCLEIPETTAKVVVAKICDYMPTCKCMGSNTTADQHVFIYCRDCAGLTCNDCERACLNCGTSVCRFCDVMCRECGETLLNGFPSDYYSEEELSFNDLVD